MASLKENKDKLSEICGAIDKSDRQTKTEKERVRKDHKFIRTFMGKTKIIYTILFTECPKIYRKSLLHLLK